MDVVTAGEHRLTCSEVVAYKAGGGQVVAILPAPKCRDAGSVVTLQLPSAKFVYDLRHHRLVGHVDRVSGTLVAGEPLVYALQESAAPRLTIVADSKSLSCVRPGETVKFGVRMAALHGPQSAPSAAHVEVRNPRGEVVDYYGANLAIGSVNAEVLVPLALNDPASRWTVMFESRLPTRLPRLSSSLLASLRPTRPHTTESASRLVSAQFPLDSLHKRA